MEGVDYSFARPAPAGLAAAGKRFAVRYVGTPSSSKSLDAAEARDLRAAGIDLVATYETTAGFMAAGADGARAAEQAAAHARSCGMPDGRPIYFALDVDPAGLTSLQWLAVEQFLDDAAGAIGRDAVGVYGGYAAIERLVPSRARWGWQTYAWSGGRWSTKAQLTQHRNGVALAGGTVDLCRSTTTDFGQWSLDPRENDMNETQLRDELEHGESRQLVKDIVTGSGVDALRARTATHPERGAWRGLVSDVVDEAVTKAIAPLAKAIAGIGDLDETEVAAALVAAMPVDALAAAIAERMPADDRTRLLDELAARLAA